MAEPNGWIEYRRLVLKELGDLGTDIKDIRKDMAGMITEISAIRQEMLIEQGKTRKEIATLKLKSSFWGAVAGASVVIATIVAQIFIK